MDWRRAQARSELEFFRELTDEAEIARLVKVFEDKVAYARMTTTRRAEQTGRSRVIYGKNGQKLSVGTPRDKARWTNWDGANLDPDSVKRHYQNLNRAGFRDNAHAKGFF
mmetsp:Transcript_12940/g.41036  ORF Transcript_12940/g.41036 Transcript_12940/m.41036 type:complete len:110 (-) Transcript_12940:209-538(-)